MNAAKQLGYGVVKGLLVAVAAVGALAVLILAIQEGTAETPSERMRRFDAANQRSVEQFNREAAAIGP